jgi:hypothetical protein
VLLGRSTLSLACRSGAAERIEVPELDVFGEVLDADFSVHVGAGLTEPDDAELGLSSLILEIDDVTRLELRVDALQRSAVAADGAQAGGLGEGAGICVNTPDFHGKLDKNALLAAPVHKWLPRRLALRIVECEVGETQVTGVTGKKFRKFGVDGWAEWVACCEPRAEGEVARDQEKKESSTNGGSTR